MTTLTNFEAKPGGRLRRPIGFLIGNGRSATLATLGRRTVAVRGGMSHSVHNNGVGSPPFSNVPRFRSQRALAPWFVSFFWLTDVFARESTFQPPIVLLASLLWVALGGLLPGLVVMLSFFSFSVPLAGLPIEGHRFVFSNLALVAVVILLVLSKRGRQVVKLNWGLFTGILLWTIAISLNAVISAGSQDFRVLVFWLMMLGLCTGAMSFGALALLISSTREQLAFLDVALFSAATLSILQWGIRPFLVMLGAQNHDSILWFSSPDPGSVTVLAVFFLLSFAWLVWSADRFSRPHFVLIGGLLVFGIVLCGSRAVMAVLLIAVVFFALLHSLRSSVSQGLISFGLVALTGLGFLSTNVASGVYLGSFLGANSSIWGQVMTYHPIKPRIGGDSVAENIRFEIWPDYVNAFLSNPIFGVGWEKVSSVADHNIFLFVAANLGLLGVALVFIPLIVVVTKLPKILGGWRSQRSLSALFWIFASLFIFFFTNWWVFIFPLPWLLLGIVLARMTPGFSKVHQISQSR